MIDLTKVSGIPMEVTDDFQLKLKPGVIQTGPSFQRKFSEMVPVLLDQTSKPPADVVYFGNRGVCMESDKEVIAQNKLTYDITILPPLMLGDEFNKTLGHYHSTLPNSSFAYPEMYEVLNGKALVLLQKLDDEMKKLVTVLAFEAVAGDKIIYPPNYGHILVNIGKDTLVTANWTSTQEVSDYEPVKEKQGMALYVVPGDDNKPTFIKNEKYTDQPLMRKMTMNDKVRTDFGFEVAEPMYTTAIRNPKLLEFLNNPIKFAVQFSELSS